MGFSIDPETIDNINSLTKIDDISDLRALDLTNFNTFGFTIGNMNSALRTNIFKYSSLEKYTVQAFQLSPPNQNDIFQVRYRNYEDLALPDYDANEAHFSNYYIARENDYIVVRPDGSLDVVSMDVFSEKFKTLYTHLDSDDNGEVDKIKELRILEIDDVSGFIEKSIFETSEGVSFSFSPQLEEGGVIKKVSWHIENSALGYTSSSSSRILNLFFPIPKDINGDVDYASLNSVVGDYKIKLQVVDEYGNIFSTPDVSSSDALYFSITKKPVFSLTELGKNSIFSYLANNSDINFSLSSLEYDRTQTPSYIWKLFRINRLDNSEVEIPDTSITGFTTETASVSPSGPSSIEPGFYRAELEITVGSDSAIEVMAFELKTNPKVSFDTPFVSNLSIYDQLSIVANPEYPELIKEYTWQIESITYGDSKFENFTNVKKNNSDTLNFQFPFRGTFRVHLTVKDFWGTCDSISLEHPFHVN